MPALNTIGLLFASGTSIANVVMDVARKKALRGNPVFETAFLVRVCIAMILTAVIAIRFWLGYGLTIHNDASESAFVISRHLAPSVVFFLYLLMDTGLVAVSVLLYFRALQVSPMSVCVPFMAFTPVFLLITGYLLLGERVTNQQMGGVVFIVCGSLIMHRDLFRKGLLEPLRALFREPGSRYILLVSFILSLSNPIDKRLVNMSNPFFQSWSYSVMIVVLLGLVSLGNRKRRVAIAGGSWSWILLAGFFDATTLLLQFISHQYIQVVVTISIKRAGIVLAVFCGWLIFHERGIGDRLIAASVMLAGALMLYIPMSNRQASIFSGTVLLGGIVALTATQLRANQISEAS